MLIAAQRLRAERATIARIAGDLGYDSEAAFNRAFKRELGATPAAWRRASRRHGLLVSRSIYPSILQPPSPVGHAMARFEFFRRPDVTVRSNSRQCMPLCSNPCTGVRR